MATQLNPAEVQNLITATTRRYLAVRDEILRHKVVLDVTDLMAEPYNFTQAENDILKGAVDDAIYGYSQTTLLNVQKQSGLF